MPQEYDLMGYLRQHRKNVELHIQKHKATWPTDQPTTADGSTESPIQVFVRSRPLLERDTEQGYYSLIEVQQSAKTIHFTHPTTTWAGGHFATKSYHASGVFGPEDGNDLVYGGMGIEGRVRRCIEESGRQFAIMAYGQTGTGKTYTTTAIEETIAADLFKDPNSPGVLISAFEMRGPTSSDLLSTPPLAPIKITATGGSGESDYTGLTVHEAPTLESLQSFIATSKELRFTRSTFKNDTSSRSHSIVKIQLKNSSTIYIVDLAGSERGADSSKNDPERQKEAIDTNKSLLSLKDCIRARLTPDGRTHVPWRGSKLTLLLRRFFDTKGAQAAQESELLVVACVSPSVVDAQDTHNTLKYVTPFQLSGQSLENSQRNFKGKLLATLVDATKWDHDESVGYITRNLPKMVPLLHRVLPTPESTLSSIFPLSVAEFTSLITTPPPDETQSVDARVVNQVKVQIPAYHKKLQDLAHRSVFQDDAETGPMVNVVGSVQQDVLHALNGTDPDVGNTGLITKFDGKKGVWVEKTL